MVLQNRKRGLGLNDPPTRWRTLFDFLTLQTRRR
jgi:hypothetical protein